MNIAIILGRLTSAPEMTTIGDKSKVSFSIAVDRDYTAKDGEKITDFIDCEAWGKKAEVIGKWFDKGHRILVTGTVRNDRWKDKETGKTRSRTIIGVDQFDFIEKKKGESPAVQNDYSYPAAPSVQNDYSFPDDTMKIAPLTQSEENDLPF